MPTVTTISKELVLNVHSFPLGYQSENLQSVQEELIHLKKDYNELAAQQEAYIAIQLNKAAQDDADLTQKVGVLL